MSVNYNKLREYYKDPEGVIDDLRTRVAELEAELDRLREAAEWMVDVLGAELHIYTSTTGDMEIDDDAQTEIEETHIAAIERLKQALKG